MSAFRTPSATTMLKVDVMTPFDEKENVANQKQTMGVTPYNKALPYPAIEPFYTPSEHSLSATQAILNELQRANATVDVLNEKVATLKNDLENADIVLKEQRQKEIRALEECRQASILNTEGMEQKYTEEKRKLVAAHEYALGQKDVEIARLHQLLNEKDKQISLGTEARKNMQARHTEMIGQISNAHDAQLTKTEDEWRQVLSNSEADHREAMELRVASLQEQAEATLLQKLASAHNANMEQMLALDAEWKLKFQRLHDKAEEEKETAAKDSMGEILGVEALHASVMEMEREQFETCLATARVESVLEYRRKIRDRLAGAQYPNGCSSCNITFGTFDRKSHCRTCGLLICSHCATESNGAGEKQCTYCRHDGV